MALVALDQVLVMFLLMAVGFIILKINMLSEQTISQMNRLLLMVVTPCVMINSFNRPFDAGLFGNLGRAFVMFALWTAFSVALAFILVRGKHDKAKIERFSMCFSNCGFMGIPLVEAALGTEAVIFAAIGIMVFNLGQWSFGRIMLVGSGGVKQTLKNIFTSPGVIGVLLGIALFVSPWALPVPAGRAVEYIGRMNTPMAMIIVGTFVAKMDAKVMLKSLRTYRVSIVRLILVPALMIPIYLVFPQPYEVMLVSYLLAACPVAAVAAMYPKMLGMDGNQGSGYVVVSTLASVATIPLMVWLLTLFIP